MVEFGPQILPSAESSSPSFGRAKWPFEPSGPRFLEKKTIELEGTIGVYAEMLYSVKRGGLDISLRLNIPPCRSGRKL